jgi:hypothetical protein
LVFFALTTLGLAAMVWTQHLDLVSLRDGDQVSDADRDALQKKALATEKRLHELEDELAALRVKAKKALADADGSADPSRQNAGRRGPNGRFANMQAMMNDPEFVKQMAVQQKAMLDNRYAALFKELALTPAQLQQFQNLLMEKQDAARDVLAAAQQQGLNFRNDRDEINQLMQQSNAEIDSQIQSALGPNAYAQYQAYEQTLPARNTANQIQTSLSYTSDPLTDDQKKKLIPILAAASPNGGNPNSPRYRFGNPSVPLTPDIISKLPLNPDQLGPLGNLVAPPRSAGGTSQPMPSR